MVEPVSLDVNLAAVRFDAEDDAMLGVRQRRERVLNGSVQSEVMVSRSYACHRRAGRNVFRNTHLLTDAQKRTG